MTIATYEGGRRLDADYGRTIIDGASLKTGSITATQLVKTAALITEHAQLGNAVVTTLKIGDNAVTMSWGANAQQLSINLAYAANVVILANARVAGVNDVYSANGAILVDGATRESGNLSVGVYTWRNTIIKTLSLPAGSHVIHQKYSSTSPLFNAADFGEYRLVVLGTYK